MNDLGETLQYAVLFSYSVVLSAGTLFRNFVLMGTGFLLGMLRLVFASRFWRHTMGERRIFVEIFLSEVVFPVA